MGDITLTPLEFVALFKMVNEAETDEAREFLWALECRACGDHWRDYIIDGAVSRIKRDGLPNHPLYLKYRDILGGVS